MSDDIKSVIGIIVIFLGLPVLILLVSDRLRKWRLARQERDRNALIASVDFHLPYRIAFTSTVDDLIQAFEADRTAMSRMSRWVRWLIVGMGCLWLLGAAAFYTGHLKNREWWLPIIWLFLGVSILWYNAVKPFLQRRHIRNSNAASQDLKLEFKQDGIHIEAPGTGEFDRTWNELDGATNCDEGILVYYTDGTVAWLPRRVFPNDDVKTALHAFLVDRMFEAEVENEPIQEK